MGTFELVVYGGNLAFHADSHPNPVLQSGDFEPKFAGFDAHSFLDQDEPTSLGLLLSGQGASGV